MRYVHPLTDEEVATLKKTVRRAKKPFVLKRAQVILCSHRRYSPMEIGQVVGLERQAVIRAIGRFEAEGFASLKPKPRPGRPPKVTDAYVKRLAQVVALSPTDFGYPKKRWTLHMLRQQLKRDAGIELSHEHVRRLLKQMRVKWRRPPKLRRSAPSQTSCTCPPPPGPT